MVTAQDLRRLFIALLGPSRASIRARRHVIVKDVIDTNVVRRRVHGDVALAVVRSFECCLADMPLDHEGGSMLLQALHVAARHDSKQSRT